MSRRSGVSAITGGMASDSCTVTGAVVTDDGIAAGTPRGFNVYDGSLGKGSTATAIDGQAPTP